MALGLVYIQERMFDKGISGPHKALYILLDLALTHRNLALAYWKKGNPEDAIRHCDRALESGGEIRPDLLESLKPYHQES
jgi:hypothetical protein